MTESSAIPRVPVRQRLLLVTGLLGAGKTTALKVLEDLGWEVIDNFPVRLLGRLIDSGDAPASEMPLAIGFDSRTRGFDAGKVIALVKKRNLYNVQQTRATELECVTAIGAVAAPLAEQAVQEVFFGRRLAEARYVGDQRTHC